MTLRKNAFPLKRCVGKMSHRGMEIATVRRMESLLSLFESSSSRVTDWVKELEGNSEIKAKQRELCSWNLCSVFV